VKLGTCAAVAIVLLVVSWFSGDSWFRVIAFLSLLVIVLPVTLLVSIDFGRVLRRRRLSRAATIATRLPQLFLGLLACIAAIGAFALTVLDPSLKWWVRLEFALVSIGLFLYGISLFRGDSVSAKHDVSS
jgi:hypothetical protein